MIEDEAKTKWCPQYQVSGEDASNRPPTWVKNDTSRSGGDWDHDQIIKYALCIGSKCMAWRIGEPKIHENVFVGGKPATSPTGYCGLAGKP